MPKADSSLSMLVVAAVMALGIGYYVPQTFSQKPGGASSAGVATAATAATAAAAAQNDKPAPGPAPGPAQGPEARPTWAASAPGRVEPAGGEIRIAPQVPGRIADVLVGINDEVKAGDLLVRLDDEDLMARVNAARAQADARKRDRDDERGISKNASDRREAEDRLYDAERALGLAREDLDRALTLRRDGGTADVDGARKALTEARDELQAARGAWRKAAGDSPAPTRIEAAFAAARAELSLATAALERARIRAPSDGTVLRIDARVGETVAPSPQSPVVVVGDVTSLRVRAEFEERDIGNIQVGQAAVVRSDAFPGKDFAGTVSSAARALGPSRISRRGPRKPTDIDVLEVIIDLEGKPPLLPGMRVDVFLKAKAAGPAPSVSTAPAGARPA